VKRVGLVGFGNIGAQLYARLSTAGSELEPAFVYNRSRERLRDVPAELVIDDLREARARRPDLIVEVAHPQVTRDHGLHLLSVADYLPLSVTALADDELRARLSDAARANGTRLLIPHGALVGADSLFEWRHMWSTVTISFRKPPQNVGQKASRSGAEISSETVLFDGSVREIASRYPTNVNAMVTCALLTVGLDRCRGRLIADPRLRGGVIEIEAQGTDGSRLSIRREQPMVGVSGTEMFESQYQSIVRAAGLSRPMDFV